jgi:hypothetical protein
MDDAWRCQRPDGIFSPPFTRATLRRVQSLVFEHPALCPQALLAFKASGGVATATALASWTNGTDPCGVPKWAGVTCSGGAAPAVTQLLLYDGGSGKFAHVAGQIGTLAPLAADLTILDLASTDAAGDVAGLAPLVKLTTLSLQNTKVHGDVKGLAPLVKLTGLGLQNTNVTGQAADLAPLTGLTLLNLDETAVAGDVKGLAPLVELTHLDLINTKVTGEAAALAPLSRLTVLLLSGTAVAGDVKVLAPLVELTYLRLDNTAVTGQAAALVPLTRLTSLDLSGTAVAGCGAFCAAGGPFHAQCDPHPDPTNGCECFCP